MENTQRVGEEDCKIFSSQLRMDVFKEKYLRKYLFSMGVMGLGLFIGGAITPGIFTGLFAAAGFGLGLERIKDVSPETYNWILDHPGWMEVITTVMFTGFFGLTATGIVGGLVTNILTSTVLDYYAEKEGKVDGVEKLTLGRLLRKALALVSNFFKGIKSEISTIRSEFISKKKEAAKCNKQEAIEVEFVPQAA